MLLEPVVDLISVIEETSIGLAQALSATAAPISHGNGFSSVIVMAPAPKCNNQWTTDYKLALGLSLVNLMLAVDGRSGQNCAQLLRFLRAA
jgi:hypothetical protein